MKAFKTLTAVAALATALVASSSPSAAVLISIGYSFNGGAISTLTGPTAVAEGDTVSWSGGPGGLTVGSYILQSVSSSFGPLPDLLSSQSLDAKASGNPCPSPCTVDVFVSMQNIDPGMLGLDTLISSFSASASNNTTLTTWYNANNAQYGTVQQLRNVTYTGGGNNSFLDAIAPPAAPFSLTEQFHVTTLGTTVTTSHVNATVDLGAAPAVPEPATWGLMIMGFGGLGALLRTRRRLPLALR